MSFQELTGGGASLRQFRGLHRESPRNVRAAQPASYRKSQAAIVNRVTQPRMSSPSLTNPKSRKSMIVLHGRVQEKESSDDEEEDILESSSSHDFSSIRTVMERKSVFSKLSHETQVFGRMVADLEELLAESGESPEAAWRARILMRSAQETDKELWNKLFAYEKSLYGDHEDAELRQARTACMKLHRDFKRIHKSLVLALSMFEKRQRAEVSRLGAVGWTMSEENVLEDPPMLTPKQPSPVRQPVQQGSPQPAVQEDYFDRVIRERDAFNQAMREREITEINKKMNEVNDIYNDLARIVDEQQEKINELEEDADYAKYNVKNVSDRFSWDMICAYQEGDDNPRLSHRKEPKKSKIDWNSLFACGNVADAADALRESYGIVYDKGCVGESRTESILSRSSDSDDSPIAVEPPSVRRSSRRFSNKSDPREFRPQKLETLRQERGRARKNSPRAPEEPAQSEEFNFTFYESFSSLAEDVTAIHGDLVTWGQGMATPKGAVTPRQAV